MASVEVGVALLGYGTVGASVSRMLAESGEEIERATGHRLRVVRALVRDLDKERSFPAGDGVPSRTMYDVFLSRIRGSDTNLADVTRPVGENFDLAPADILLSEAELAERRMQLQAHPYVFPKSQTPWQEIQREMVAQFDEGMVLKPAVGFQRIAQTAGVPRDNH